MQTFQLIIHYWVVWFHFPIPLSHSNQRQDTKINILHNKDKKHNVNDYIYFNLECLPNTLPGNLAG